MISRLWQIIHTSYCAFFVLMLAGCVSPINATKGRIVNYKAVFLIDSIGVHTFSAKAPIGTQMIGGGYRVTPNDLGDARPSGSPVVISNYPSSADTWTVDVMVPDFRVPVNLVVTVDCYCFVGSEKLGMAINTSQPHSVPKGTTITTSDRIDAPPDTVVTAGGWRTTIPPEYKNDIIDVIGAWSAGIWGSRPATNSGAIPIGWITDFEWRGVFGGPTFQTFVMYAKGYDNRSMSEQRIHPMKPRQIFTAGPAKQASIYIGPLPGAERFGRVDCDPGYFSSGGGFQLADFGANQTNPDTAQLVPHYLHASSTLYALPEYDPGNPNRSEFGGWSTLHFHLHEYQGATKAVETGSVWTVQLGALAPPLSVKILQPANGSEIQTYDSAFYAKPLVQTAPITFVAVATDSDGSNITGSNLIWTIAGVPGGTGETVTSPIQVANGTPQANSPKIGYKISVLAKGKSETATASIFIYSTPPTAPVR